MKTLQINKFNIDVFNNSQKEELNTFLSKEMDLEDNVSYQTAFIQQTVYQTTNIQQIENVLQSKTILFIFLTGFTFCSFLYKNNFFSNIEKQFKNLTDNLYNRFFNVNSIKDPKLNNNEEIEVLKLEISSSSEEKLEVEISLLIQDTLKLEIYLEHIDIDDEDKTFNERKQALKRLKKTEITFNDEVISNLIKKLNDPLITKIDFDEIAEQLNFIFRNKKISLIQKKACKSKKNTPLTLNKN